MERKTFPFECKVDMDKNTFEGYFSIKGNIDDGNDRVLAGAFTKTFQENRKRIKGLYMHDFKKPFSKPIELFEDSKGAYVKGSISLCSWGQDIKILMADGVVDEMSFGYDVVKSDFEKVSGENVRNLREVKCWEYSPVTWGMNSETSINSVKSLNGLDNIFNLLDEIKAGRAISNNNRGKIQSAIDALMALLGDEPPQDNPSDEVDCSGTRKPEKSLENIDSINPDVLQLLLQEVRKYQ